MEAGVVHLEAGAVVDLRDVLGARAAVHAACAVEDLQRGRVGCLPLRREVAVDVDPADLRVQVDELLGRDLSRQ